MFLAALAFLAAADDPAVTPADRRRAAFEMLAGRMSCGAASCDGAAVALLKSAARDGDLAALIRLELLRRAGANSAPSEPELVAIETTRAERGDPVAAWRLAGRYERGEGVAVSEGDSLRWLAAAAAHPTYAKAPEAAYRLCARLGAKENPDEAARWCREAAARGHAAARLVLAQIKVVDG